MGGSSPSKEVSVAQIASRAQEPITEHSVTDIKIPEDQVRYAFTAHFAEVEVDVETGFVDVVNYIAVHDSGTIMNALTAESQIRGSIIMGIGTALSEEMIVDENFGMISNPTLWSYRLPTQTIVPPIKVEFIDPNDPYGPKSLGEIGMVPVPAVIGNAIFNATGARLKEIPMTPDRVLRALGKDI
ncbi:MAG: xanthine dehydrogenase family protein molybdopterin-binding subunit [Nitrososphaerales archaeon]